MKRICVLLLSIILSVSAVIPSYAAAEEDIPATYEELLVAYKELLKKYNALLGVQDKPEEFDIRKFHWGDSPDDVIAVEGTPAEEDDVPGTNLHYIAYAKKLLEMSLAVYFYFNTTDNLVKVKYRVRDDHSGSYDLYGKDWEELQKILNQKYGEPVETSEEIMSTLYDSHVGADYGYWKCAYLGDIWLSDTYETDRTIIRHAFEFEIGTSGHTIEYTNNGLFDISIDY